MCNIILSLILDPQLVETPLKVSKMPKAHRKSVEEEEDDVPLHGPINEADAKQYYLGPG